MFRLVFLRLFQRELEKVKKRRLERERELEEREREREQLQRDKEAEYFREWEKQEDSFHLQQAKMRSEIRIQDGRAKPIDLLAKYISAEDDELAVEMHEPYTYLYVSIWAASWQNQQNGCASSEDSDQPGLLPSLIRVFAMG